MQRNRTLESKILARVIRKKSMILLREDFLDLGGYDQVGRALKLLIFKGKIVRLGYGLYCKTKISSLTGETLLAAPLTTVAKEALSRLGVQVIPSSAEIAYNAGRSWFVTPTYNRQIKSELDQLITVLDSHIPLDPKGQSLPR